MDDKSVVIPLGTTAGLLFVACISWCFWKKIGKSRQDAAAPAQEREEAVREDCPLLSKGSSRRPPSPTFSILRHTTGLPVWPTTIITTNYMTFRQVSQGNESTDSTGSTRNESHRKHKRLPSCVYIPPVPDSIMFDTPDPAPRTMADTAAAVSDSGNASGASNVATVPPYDDSVLDDDDYEIHVGTPRTTFILNKLIPKPPPEPEFDLTKHITR